MKHPIGPNFKKRRRTQFLFSKPSRTKQQFKDETDINNILKKFAKSGNLEHVNNARAHYGDFSAFTGFQDSLELVRHAEGLFMGLSADIRAAFENDPQKFFDFAEDPRNADTLVNMGLAKKRLIVEPEPSQAVSKASKKVPEVPSQSEPSKS